MNEKLSKERIEKLIFDDGRRCEFKIKIGNFPFLLKRKIESMSSNSGRKIEDVITMMLDNEIKSVKPEELQKFLIGQIITYLLDNEVKSVEKILGAENV